MNDISKRLYVAIQILNGACAGDWKFDLPNGMKWDDVACIRAFELADKLIETETSVITNPKPVAKPKPVKKVKPK
jgi:hypothetical protein